jgi:hypothetical protein
MIDSYREKGSDKILIKASFIRTKFLIANTQESAKSPFYQEFIDVGVRRAGELACKGYQSKSTLSSSNAGEGKVVKIGQRLNFSDVGMTDWNLPASVERTSWYRFNVAKFFTVNDSGVLCIAFLVPGKHPLRVLYT